jgi:hypothetical protein
LKSFKHLISLSLTVIIFSLSSITISKFEISLLSSFWVSSKASNFSYY